MDGIFSSAFKAKATIKYDGSTSGFSGNSYLDNLLISASEDSLVLMYRKNAEDEWAVYPYYTKNMVVNKNDKYGIVTIDSLRKGEYTFAMKDYTLSILSKQSSEVAGIKIYPNPSKYFITVDLCTSLFKIPDGASLLITDISGKTVYNEITGRHKDIIIETKDFNNGIYIISVKSKDVILAKTKFIIAH